jgi:hypothetical protein
MPKTKTKRVPRQLKRPKKPATTKKNVGMGPMLKRYIEQNPGRMTNRILNLARSRKPTGRLNIDDFNNARESGFLAGASIFGKTGSSKGPAGKVRKKRGGPVDMPKRTKIGKTIKPKLGLPPKRKR